MSDDGCGCSGGTACGCDATAAPARPPGDPAWFRHGAVLERTLDLIARAEVHDTRPLERWTTRALDDPGIALLSAQAGASHVLAWNVHRQHADATLAGSEDPDALLLLTGLLGHRRRPALAATTVLSFALDEIETAPRVVTVPSGTKVSSVPLPDETPQVFETDAALEARREWNELRPLRGPEPQVVTTTTPTVVLAGTGLPVRVGDSVLVETVLARVTGVTTDDTAPEPSTTLALAGGVAVIGDGAPSDTAIVLGDRAAPFGATAPDIRFMPEDVRTAEEDESHVEWRNLTVSFTGASGQLDLDAVYPAAAPGRLLAILRDQAAPHLVRATTVVERARNQFGLSARVSRVQVEGSALNELTASARELSVLLETAQLALVVPLADPILPDAAQPDRLHLLGHHALPPGRRVVLRGDDPTTGAPTTESATVHSAEPVTDDEGVAATLLRLDAPVARRFRASSLVVLANCVAATQAESALPTPAVPGAEPGVEVLGSGDPAVPLPRFRLARKPLAHVPAPGPTGYAPDLAVRVDGRAYTRAETLPGDQSTSRAYRVLAVPGDASDVQFAGRLPTGAGNVTAVYRSGGGAAGNLGAGRLVQALTPVLGVRAVTNPVPADGGSDAETIEEMRRTAPRAIRTLGRVVALSDFAAFAEGYRGVGQAAVDELLVGRARTVVVTVSTTTYAAPEPGALLLDQLRAAILDAAPPGTRVLVRGFVELAMRLVVAFAHNPALRRADVETAARAALLDRFGPAVRPFGRAVHRSEVVATVQDVPGVVTAGLTEFAASGVTEDAEGRLPCPGPVSSGADVQPARRLSLASDDLRFEELLP